MKDIQIGHRLIGPKHIPFIIAEMSGNHNQSLDRALEIVDAAANAGAHALKLQTYTADTITMKGVFSIQDKILFGTGKNFMICIVLHIHPGNGMLLFLTGQRRKECWPLVLLLMKWLLIFLKA